MFGRLLARHVAEVDGLLDSPSRFDLVEFGPGRGTLARDLLGELQASNPDLYSRLVYHLIEISPSLIEEQRALLLPSHAGRVVWSGALAAHNLSGAVIANEFVDALPVHVIKKRDGILYELYVGVQAGELAFIDGQLSTSMLADFVERSGIELEDGEQVEINLNAATWLKRTAAAFSRCVALVIDYGDVAPGRYSAARKEGTLLGYYGGKVTHDILSHPGEQDLTALVDFSALQSDAVSAGFDVIAMTRQATLLVGLGLGTNSTYEGEADLSTTLAERRGIQALASMEGLGRFHVLMLSKGLDPKDAETRLSGLKYKDIL